jgi:hypothetical protein
VIGLVETAASRLSLGRKAVVLVAAVAWIGGPPAGAASLVELDVDLAATTGNALHEVDFEDVATGTPAPFVSRGVHFDIVPGTGTFLAVSTMSAIGDHGANFGNAGSEVRFVTASKGMRAVLPANATAVGLAIRSPDCDVGGIESTINWRLRAEDGTIVDSGMAVLAEGCPVSAPVYLGIVSPTAFRSLDVFRTSGSDFLVDDLQYGPVVGLSMRQPAPPVPTGGLTARFEDVAVGTPTPFVSGGLQFGGAALPGLTLFGVPHSFWFPGAASPPQFLVANFAFDVTAPGDFDVIRLDYSNGSAGTERMLDVATHAMDGSRVQTLSLRVQSNGGHSLQLYGLLPARSVKFDGMKIFTGASNFVVDDLQLSRDGVFDDGLEDPR